MAEYSRFPQRFAFTGIQAVPADALSPGKLPFGRNLRSYEPGVITVRDGLVAQGTVSAGTAVHSLARLNDSTPFNGGSASVRVSGAGGSLYRGPATGFLTFSLLDSGYSGNPVVTLAAQPPNSPRPYLYIADSSRQRKVTSNGAVVPIGIPQVNAPTDAPAVRVGQLGSQRISAVTYVAAGTNASAPTTASRVSTLIGQILYDSGATGYASLVPSAFTNITEGMFITVGGERVIITELTIAVASTTVEAIIYDAGNTGLCTIQPAGSLGTGQLEAPSIEAYRKRAARAWWSWMSITK